MRSGSGAVSVNVSDHSIVLFNYNGRIVLCIFAKGLEQDSDTVTPFSLECASIVISAARN